MKIKCRCGAIYQIRPEHAGKRMKCRKCSHQFAVPSQRPATSQENLESSTSQSGMPAAPGAASYWVKPGEVAPPQQRGRKSNQNKSKQKLTRPTGKQTKAQKDEALLQHYSSGSSLEERMAQRRRERIEDGRISNGFTLIFYGLAWFAGAGLIFWLLNSMNGDSWGFGRLRFILVILYYLRAQYWLPPTLALIGFYECYLGIGSLLGKVDVDDQDDLPEHFG